MNNSCSEVSDRCRKGRKGRPAWSQYGIDGFGVLDEGRNSRTICPKEEFEDFEGVVLLVCEKGNLIGLHRDNRVFEACRESSDDI